jgi:hypothetical protein
MVSLPLTDEERAVLSRPNGNTVRGGFQILIEKIQGGFREGGRRLELADQDAERVVKCADSYGSGTYQSVLRTIAPKCAAALAARPNLQSDLFGDDDE